MIVEVTGKLIIDMRAREWCLIPYSMHAKGCPNYGKRPECPPQAPFIQNFIDLSRAHFFVVEIFDMKAQVEKMALNPRLKTNAQRRCCLYWQNGVRKRLIEQVEDFITGFPQLVYTLIPEAMGIDVIKTAQNVGIPIETKPKDTIYKIALVGFRKV